MKRSWKIIVLSLLTILGVLACQILDLIPPRIAELTPTVTQTRGRAEFTPTITLTRGRAELTPTVAGTRVGTASPITALSPSPRPPATTALEAELTLVGYNYTSRDGGGWNVGRVWLALENRTNRLASFDKVRLLSPVVETREGQTYNGELGYEGNYYTDPNTVDPVPLIPPGFRVLAASSQLSDKALILAVAVRVPLYVTFRFAYAAHPTALTFPGTKHRIDLSAAQTKLTGFVGSDSSSFKSITTLYGRVLVDDPNGAKVIVKGCTIRETAGAHAGLDVSIENRNKFQKTLVGVPFPPAGVAITSDGGRILSPRSGGSSFAVGPAQTEVGWINLISGERTLDSKTIASSYVIFYDEPPNKYTIYTLKDCTVIP